MDTPVEVTATVGPTTISPATVAPATSRLEELQARALKPRQLATKLSETAVESPAVDVAGIRATGASSLAAASAASATKPEIRALLDRLKSDESESAAPALRIYRGEESQAIEQTDEQATRHNTVENDQSADRAQLRVVGLDDQDESIATDSTKDMTPEVQQLLDRLKNNETQADSEYRRAA